MKKTLIIFVAALALALPSAALAQDGYGPSGGVLPGESSGGGPSGTSGGGGGQKPAAVVEQGVQGAQTNSGGQLPFTGSDLLLVAGVGLVLVGAGIGLRRLRENP